MHISTIKRGHYGLLEIHVKLAIFRELVAQALDTDTVKDKLDEYIEERQALAATRRDEALDEGRKRREEKERRKSEATGKEVKEERRVRSGEGIHNEVISERSNAKVLSRSNHSSGNRLELVVFVLQVRTIAWCVGLIVTSPNLFFSLCHPLFSCANIL